MGEGYRSCSRCGRELRARARFCGKCGQPVSANAAQAAIPGSTVAPPAGMLPPSGGPGRPSGPGRRPALVWPLVAVLAVLAVGGVTSAFFLSRHSQGEPVADVGAGLSSSPDIVASTQTAPPPLTEGQAAQNLSVLLARSADDRTSIVNAVNDVSQCGPDLGQDSQVFQSAAASRQGLLSQLASLLGRSALSAPMIQDLTGAWQASAEADQDFAQWAQDEASQGCTADDRSDQNYQAADAPDNEATADKEAFVGLWNPIATSYGLPTYQWEQL
jgi:zinc-ribbon domain